MSKLRTQSFRQFDEKSSFTVPSKIISNLLDQQRVIQRMVIQDQSRQSNSLFRHSDRFKNILTIFKFKGNLLEQ